MSSKEHPLKNTKRPPRSAEWCAKISESKKGTMSRLGTTHSPETKLLLSKKAQEQFDKTGHPRSGAKLSDETKQKLRIARANQLRNKLGQTYPNYNPTACQLFEEINRELGWFGQHAENGGEFYIKELGYWVDYYEPNHNVVVEYDEKHHNRRTYKQKDARRQQEIENHLGCKFLRVQESDTFDCIKHTINESIGV